MRECIGNPKTRRLGLEHKQLFWFFKAEYVEDRITFQVTLCKEIDVVLWKLSLPSPQTRWRCAFQQDMCLSLAYSEAPIRPQRAPLFLIDIFAFCFSSGWRHLRTTSRWHANYFFGAYNSRLQFPKWLCRHVIKSQLSGKALTSDNHLIEENGRWFIILNSIFLSSLRICKGFLGIQMISKCCV